MSCNVFPLQVEFTVHTGSRSFEANGYRLGDLWTVYKMDSIHNLRDGSPVQRGEHWFKRLPDTPFIMKINDDADQFAQEVTTYKRLEPLQGDVLPHLYGTATCIDGAGNHFDRVLLLQYIEGHQLSTTPRDDQRLVISMLYPAYEKISRFDVIHGDPSLNNAIYVPACSRNTTSSHRSSRY